MLKPHRVWLKNLRSSVKRFLLPILIINAIEIVIIYIFPESRPFYVLQDCYLDKLPGVIPGKWISNDGIDPETLEDVLLSSVRPTPGRTIFFLETKCQSDKLEYFVNLTQRQVCSIESAALHNPNFQVFVIFANPKIIDEQNPLIRILRSYKNIHLRQLNIWRYVMDTPVEDWILRDNKFLTRFPTEHISDLLRLLTLYRFGGIYLDMDVVVLRSLETVPLNYVGAQITDEISNAVISLEPTGIGHEIANLFLRDFQRNFDGGVYLYNGPRLIQRVLEQICDTKAVKEMMNNRRRCHGMQLFHPSAFYILHNFSYFFDHRQMAEAMAKTKDSYLVHLWNKGTHECVLKVGSNTAYAKYAEQNCPKSYAAADEYF